MLWVSLGRVRLRRFSIVLIMLVCDKFSWVGWRSRRLLWVCVTLGVIVLVFTLIEERRVRFILFGLIWVAVMFRWVVCSCLWSV